MQHALQQVTSVGLVVVPWRLGGTDGVTLQGQGCGLGLELATLLQLDVLHLAEPCSTWGCHGDLTVLLVAVLCALARRKRLPRRHQACHVRAALPRVVL